MAYLATLDQFNCRVGHDVRGYNKIDVFYMTTYGISVGDILSLLSYFVVLVLLIVLLQFQSFDYTYQYSVGMT